MRYDYEVSENKIPLNNDLQKNYGEVSKKISGKIF